MVDDIDAVLDYLPFRRFQYRDDSAADLRQDALGKSGCQVGTST
ncbi:hypothetical protein ULF88_21945 [Halopseudomonas pachastrellae]|nr:hypothetical protein [Halopseudomonas pachastrellae]